MATAIWYPAPIGTQEAERRVSIFKAGWSAQGAPLASSRWKFPLVVVDGGNDVAIGCERLCEPSKRCRPTAGSVGKHHERKLPPARRQGRALRTPARSEDAR